MKKLISGALLTVFSLCASAALPEPTFEADFTNTANFLAAKHGNNLQFTNAGGELTQVNGPQGKPAVSVPKNSYFTVDISNSERFNAEGYLNDWSMVMDVKFPVMRTWYAFFQTTLANDDDAEVFISSSYDGIGGYYATGTSDNGGYSINKFEAGKWYRIIFNYDCNKNTFSYYVDGQLLWKGVNGNAFVNSRYALPKKLLLFADNDGDDGTIEVSDIKIYDKKLTASQCREHGGFGNTVTPNPGIVVESTPFLYDPQPDMMRISWHSGDLTPGKILYGTDAANLDKQSESSKPEPLDDDEEIILNSVKLTGLTPNTLYYYSVEGQSKVYSFKTLPTGSDLKKVRFITMSDTHANYQGNTSKIAGIMKASMGALGISDIHDINFIIHTGDFTDDGDNPGDYSTMLGTALKDLTPYIPMLVVPGNHDKESPLFFKYFRNDDISGAGEASADFGHYWKKQLGSVLLLGLDSWSYWPYDPVICRDRTPGLGEREKAWLKETLDAAEADPNITMVFAYCHECPISELWYSGWKYTFTNTDLYPILKGYSKVQQITYGHAHGTEFGVSEPADDSKHDIMLFNNGNSGGLLDGWGKIYDAEHQQNDEAEVNYSHPEYAINYGEIDIENGKYAFQVWSVAEDDKDASNITANWFDTPVLRYSWYGDVKQEAPKAPANLTLSQNGNIYNISCDAYDEANAGQLFSSQFQLVQKANDGSLNVLVNSLRDCRNYYRNEDKNAGINLCSLEQQAGGVTFGNDCFVRARFRDDNRKWSDWATFPRQSSGIADAATDSKVAVFCEADAQTIHVVMPEGGVSTVAIVDMQGRSVVNETVSGTNFSWNYAGARGVYVLSVKSAAGEVQTCKILAR